MNLFKSKAEKELEQSKMLKKLQPEDLLKFGLIPEFIGRVPVYAVLDALDEETLKMILTEPKNAIIRQYMAMLKLDDADLEFTDGALDAVADLAIRRKTGARGIRAIVESFMTDVMYRLPSVKGHKKVLISEDVVLGNKKPDIIKG